MIWLTWRQFRAQAITAAAALAAFAIVLTAAERLWPPSVTVPPAKVQFPPLGCRPAVDPAVRPAE